MRIPSPGLQIRAIVEDLLGHSIPSTSAESAVCSIGIKTLSAEQRVLAARDVQRIRQPGGPFRILEIVVPAARVHRVLFHFDILLVVFFPDCATLVAGRTFVAA